MIFLLDLTLSTLQTELPEEFELAISRLVLAHRDGSHLLVISRTITHELLKREWSPIMRATLQRIGNNSTQFASIVKSSKYVLCVRETADTAASTPENYRVIGAADVVRHRLHLPTVLLVENAKNDGEFFRLLLETLGRRIGARPLRFETTHGGGDDISSTFEGQIEQGRFVVTVIDSDKKSPFSTSPPKYHKLMALKERRKWEYSVVAMLECREIENLLSPTIVMTLKCSYEYRHKVLLERLVNREEDLFGQNSIWRYLDLKEGITRESVDAMDGRGKQWLLEKLKPLSLGDPDRIIEGVGVRIMPCFLEDPARQQVLNELACKNRQWMTSFKEVFEDLTWYFVASPRQFT
jgi:hypothetical protein